MGHWNADKIGVITRDHVDGEVSKAYSDQTAVVGENGGEDSAVSGLVEHSPDLDSLGDAHGTGDEDGGSTAHEVEEAVDFGKQRG